jgi:16S rRNA processing protein RimM
MSNQQPPPPGNKQSAHALPSRPSPGKGATHAAPESGLATDWVTLGEIVAPFGLRGEVKLLAQTDFPDRVATHATLYLGPKHQPYALLETRPHGGVILLRFDGIDDLTAAEKLRGLIVCIPQAEAAPLAEDQYYIHDLIGLRAIHINGTELGTVMDVFVGSGQELLAIRRAGRQNVLVPLVKALVPAIDLTDRTVTIDPPAGLFDDDTASVENDEDPD